MQIYKMGVKPQYNSVNLTSKSNSPTNNNYSNFNQNRGLTTDKVMFTSYLTPGEIAKIKKGFTALDKKLDTELNKLSQDFVSGEKLEIANFKDKNSDDLSNLGLYIKDLSLEIIPEQNFYTTKIIAKSHSGTKTEVTFPDGSVDRSRMVDLLNPLSTSYFNFMKKLSAQFNDLSRQFIMDSTEAI